MLYFLINLSGMRHSFRKAAWAQILHSLSFSLLIFWTLGPVSQDSDTEEWLASPLYIGTYRKVHTYTEINVHKKKITYISSFFKLLCAIVVSLSIVDFSLIFFMFWKVLTCIQWNMSMYIYGKYIPYIYSLQSSFYIIYNCFCLISYNYFW